MILDGKAFAKEVQEDIKITVSALKGRKPCLAVILVGHDPASHLYIARKTKACAEVGIQSLRFDFPVTASEQELLKLVWQLNEDPTVDGILIQMPLPDQINASRVMMAVDPTKDVDGFHPINQGKLLAGERDGFVPCTPLGIHYMLQRADIPVEGKHVVIFGRSNIVGRPMAALLLQNAPGCNASVTVVHRYSQNTGDISSQADIVICAIGKPKHITADMIKKGAVVIDVGINKVVDPTHSKGYIIVGDVDFDQVKKKCSYITPVPGGVGPLTIAMLLKNTLRAYQLREQREA
jgi:methylenetetrahydrofolate dehydrogenase (NADP+)/methenyltetrahydrofolate cyclohydrolase